MKKTAIVGVVAAAIGLVVVSQVSKFGNAGYVLITGTTKYREAVNKYFQIVYKSLKNVV